jgi:hypothetical protein
VFGKTTSLVCEVYLRSPFLTHMAGSVCFMPKLFPESLEIENRKRLALASNLGENMNHLLGDGPVFLVSSCLDFTIESIRHVLDIQGSHISSITPPVWRNLQKRSSQRSGRSHETRARYSVRLTERLILRRFQIAESISKYHVTMKRTKDSEIITFQFLPSCASRPSW